MVFEYVRHVFRKRFLFGLLSVPLFVGVMALVVMLLVRSEINLKPIGYVDESGILTNPEALPDQVFQSSLVKLIAFDGEELAQEALQAEQIQAYYVIDAAYPESRQAKLVAIDEPSNMATSQFRQFVRANLIADFPSDVVRRLTAGSQLVIQLSITGCG
jgi:ABC-type Na+ efflux pump permease subunit